MTRGLRPGGGLGWRAWGNVFAWASFFLLSFCCFGDCGEVAPDGFKSLLDPEWQKVERASSGMSYPSRPVLWSYQISPPFPMDWPPEASRRLCYYAYATGFSVQGGLVDGVYVAAPWCRVIVTPSGSAQPTLERLSDRLREIGIQGVMPISAEEKDIYDQAESVERLLATLKAAPEASATAGRQLRAYYCTWAGHNGTVVPEIRGSHESFFRWLACK
jgi:hypothetical protein